MSSSSNDGIKSVSLSSKHYAYSWPATSDETINEVSKINKLGIRYAQLPDGPEKESLLLEIIKAFDPYLRKYLNMIMRGHLPHLSTPAGQDAAKMLRTLVSKKQTPTHAILLARCRTLHLAFKQHTADDIYDILAMCLMRAIRKYDPNYTGKILKVCEAINVLGRKKQFSADEISRLTGFDSVSCLRLLVRKKVLASVAGPKKKIVGYVKTSEWPLPNSFFKSGPIGFTYVLQTWFRYYLHEYVSGAMAEIESKDSVLQLEHRTHGAGGDDMEDVLGLSIPHAEGNFTDTEGNVWAADVGLINLPMDVSSMTREWVRGTKDKLFRKLTRKERHFLYLVFVKELKWVELAEELDCDVPKVKRQFEQIMSYLKARAGANRPQSI